MYKNDNKGMSTNNNINRNSLLNIKTGGKSATNDKAADKTDPQK